MSCPSAVIDDRAADLQKIMKTIDFFGGGLSYNCCVAFIETSCGSIDDTRWQLHLESYGTCQSLLTHRVHIARQDCRFDEQNTLWCIFGIFLHQGYWVDMMRLYNSHLFTHANVVFEKTLGPNRPEAI